MENGSVDGWRGGGGGMEVFDEWRKRRMEGMEGMKERKGIWRKEKQMVKRC